MGCTTSQESIELRILELKLKKIEINKKREEECKLLEELEGKRIIRPIVRKYKVHSIDEATNSVKDMDNPYETSNNHKPKIKNDKYSNMNNNIRSKKGKIKINAPRNHNSCKNIHSSSHEDNEIPKRNWGNRTSKQYKNKKKSFYNEMPFSRNQRRVDKFNNYFNQFEQKNEKDADNEEESQEITRNGRNTKRKINKGNKIRSCDFDGILKLSKRK